jgi:formylglycine-generating enzyme required for sulfatase activity
MVLGSLAVCFAFGAWADGATVSDVTVRQRWPWSRLVDIDYTLACDPTQRVDVTVSACNGSQALFLPADSLGGDLYNVGQGFRRIVVDPMKTAYTNEPLTQFSVDVRPASSSNFLYMIVNLTKSFGEIGQIAYLTESDLAGGQYGTVATNFVNGVASIAWTGVTNDIAYMTDKLVMRRVRAGSFTMGGESDITGAGTTNVALTHDFFVGVFEVTQRQWELIKGNRPSFYTNLTCYAARPVERVSYNDIRGTSAQGGGGWPTNSGIYAQSFLGKLRTQTGIGGFDLPTAAQAECACRAGTATFYHDGIEGIPSGAETESNSRIAVLGRYRNNGGGFESQATQDVSVATGTATVGNYRPNAWGVFDTHGNVYEWCLDWYSTQPSGGTDPSGELANASGCRTLRGGGYQSNASTARSARRLDRTPVTTGSDYGFRLVITLP